MAEFLPLLAFVYSGRLDADLATRFYWGAGAAVVVVPILAASRWDFNPLLVATNLWLCVEAFAFLVHIAPLADVLRFLQESAFFAAMIIVGVIYAALSARGLLTAPHANRARVRRYSIVLLALMVGGLACSVAFRGEEVYSAALPATAVFLAQMLISAHLRDEPPAS